MDSSEKISYTMNLFAEVDQITLNRQNLPPLADDILGHLRLADGDMDSFRRVLQFELLGASRDDIVVAVDALRSPKAESRVSRILGGQHATKDAQVGLSEIRRHIGAWLDNKGLTLRSPEIFFHEGRDVPCAELLSPEKYLQRSTNGVEIRMFDQQEPMVVPSLDNGVAVLLKKPGVRAPFALVQAFEQITNEQIQDLHEAGLKHSLKAIVVYSEGLSWATLWVMEELRNQNLVRQDSISTVVVPSAHFGLVIRPEENLLIADLQDKIHHLKADISEFFR